MAHSGIDEFLQKMKVLFVEKSTKHGVGATEYKSRRFFAASAECLERMQTWQMPQNSIIVSSFPKTGTAWANEVVRHILYGNDEEALARSRTIPMPMLVLELGSPAKFDFYEKLPVERKFFITHVPVEFFDYDMLKKTNSKMIYVYRNPKDQIVSWFHFSKKLPLNEAFRKELGETWDEFYTNCINGRHPSGLPDGGWYLDHILGWLKYRNDENFLMLEYESMKKDISKEIRRIARFLGVTLTNAHCGKVIQNCTVESMRKSLVNEPFFKMNVRKGQVGTWKDILTVAQSELLDKRIKEKMTGSGINFTYVL